MLAPFRSPTNLTYPPRGTAQSFHRVPCRSVKPASSGPKPIEKAVTPTPHQRPTRKCPISCTNTTIVRMTRKPSAIASTLSAPPPNAFRMFIASHPQGRSRQPFASDPTRRGSNVVRFATARNADGVSRIVARAGPSGERLAVRPLRSPPFSTGAVNQPAARISGTASTAQARTSASIASASSTSAGAARWIAVKRSQARSTRPAIP